MSNIPTNPWNAEWLRAAFRAIKRYLDRVPQTNGDAQYGTVKIFSADPAFDGTASAPSYSFTNDPNTGIYRPGTDSLGVTLGGTLCRRDVNVASVYRSAMSVGWSSSSTAPSSGTMDVSLSRGAADVLQLASADSFRPADAAGQKLGDATHTWRVYHDVIATASLPAAAAAMDGVILIEDAGAGDRNLVVYAGGERFRIDGGATF